MKYRVSRDAQGIDVDISDLGEGQGAVMDAFAACADGRCRCPLMDSVDFDAVRLEAVGDGVHVSLPTRDGGEVDTRVLERCLDGTLKRLSR